MSIDDELVNEVWVSNNFTSVFFSQIEVRRFLDSLLKPNEEPPLGLNIALMSRKLLSPKTRREIKSASPEKLKEWMGVED